MINISRCFIFLTNFSMSKVGIGMFVLLLFMSTPAIPQQCPPDGATPLYQCPSRGSVSCEQDRSRQTCTKTCNGQLTTSSTCRATDGCATYSCGAVLTYSCTLIGYIPPGESW